MSRVFDCDQCGGLVEMVSVSGRMHEYLAGIMLPVPADVAVATCRECGETYQTSAEAEELERRLEGAYTEYCKELVASIRERTGVMLRDIEKAVGVTPTYLSHVLSGRKRASLTLIRLLQAFAVHPDELRRHLEGADWRSALKGPSPFGNSEMVFKNVYRRSTNVRLEGRKVCQRYQREPGGTLVAPALAGTIETGAAA